MRRKRKKVDPVERFMEEALKNNGQFAPYYCADHGKHFMLPGIRPECPVCGSACFTPEEWEYQNSPRIRRVRRIQLLRNHLE